MGARRESSSQCSGESSLILRLVGCSVSKVMLVGATQPESIFSPKLCRFLRALILLHGTGKLKTFRFSAWIPVPAGNGRCQASRRGQCLWEVSACMLMQRRGAISTSSHQASYLPFRLVQAAFFSFQASMIVPEHSLSEISQSSTGGV